MTKAPKISIVAALLGLLLLAALAGCAPDTSAPELQPRPAGETAAEALEVALAPTPTLTSAELARTAEAVALANAGCLQCHTDEEQLRDLAVEEVVVSLSEGPG